MQLSIYYQNVRGLRTKTGTFYTNLLCECYDIVILTETWLCEGICTSELFDNRYSVYRKDRDPTLTGRERGGGCLVAVANKFSSQLIDHDSPLETLFVEVRLGNSSLMLNAVYLPPESNLSVYRLYFSAFNDISSSLKIDDRILVAGDFNISTIRGPRHDFSSDSSSRIIGQLMEMHSLQSYNHVVNVDNKTLDLIFSNLELRVESETQSLVTLDPKHPALCMSLPVVTTEKNSPNNNNCGKYDYKQANFDLLTYMLMSSDWNELNQCDNVDEAVRVFYERMYYILDVCVPKVGMKRRRFPPWFTSDIILDIKLKNYHSYRRHISVYHSEQFKVIRKRLKYKTRMAYNRYLHCTENSLKYDLNNLWNFVKSRKGASLSSSCFKSQGGVVAESRDIAQGFADHFQSVFDTAPVNDNVNNLISLEEAASGNQRGNIFSVGQISVRDVELAINKLKSKKSTGPDDIPSYIYKACKEFLIYPLLIIFNLSVQTGAFPTAFKNSKTIPLYKSGDKQLFSNYRQIVILNALAKVFENVLHDKIYTYVNTYISTKQHGFVKKRSTVTNLITLSDYVVEQNGRGAQVDVVYTDFARAFDRVDHGILLKKLKHLGFDAPSLCLISSYLRCRNQVVYYQGAQSIPFTAWSGVPQGSNLGPLLFILFVNDLPLVVQSPCLMYADDFKIFNSVSAYSDGLKLQQDLDAILKWSLDNKLDLNIRKCQVMTFTRRREICKLVYCIDSRPLERVYQVKDLGVIFDCSLSFKKHIEHITCNAYRTLGFVRRISKEFKTIDTAIYLYNSLVRPILEYAVVVWNPTYVSYSQEIETVQNIFIKFIYFLKYNRHPPFHSYDPLRKEFGIAKLEHRRIGIVLCFLHKLANHLIDSQYLYLLLNFYVPGPRMRPRPLMFLPSVKYDSPINRMCILYNRFHKQISCGLQDVSETVFRKTLKQVNFNT